MSDSLLLRRRLLLGNNKIELLPCVESTHSTYTYINTGIKASDKLKVELDFKPTVTPTETNHLGLFGSRANDSISKEFVLAYRMGGQFRTDRNAKQQFLFGQIDTNRHKFVMDNTKVYFDDSLLKTFNSNAFTGYDMYLGTFNTYNGSLNKSLGCRYYSFKMWENSLLVRDFRPAKNNDVYGFYDLVEKKFYSSLVEPFKPCSNWAEELGYVSNGLVFQIDGIFNTKNGNDKTSNVWEDLVGDNFVPIGSNTWGLNCLNCSSNMTSNKVIPDLGENCTMEIVYEYEGETYHQCGLKNGTPKFKGRPNTQSPWWQHNSSLKVNYTSPLAYNTFYSVATTRSANVCKAFLNGILKATSTLNLTGNSGKSLLDIGSGAEIMKGKIYAIRLYNRALTDEELLQNYNIDNERFGG